MSSPCEMPTKKAHSDLCNGSKMSRTITIQLAKPVTSVEILDNYHDGIGTEQISMQDAKRPLATGSGDVSQLCRLLQSLLSKLNQFYDKVFAEHREKIAGLSVQIARKILMQKVQDGDYEIESVVKEVLKNAPSHHDLVVHLNPEDLVKCQKIQKDDNGSLAGIKFVVDANIGRAECLLETDKGIVESLIDEHLERIGKALEKTG